MEKIFNLVFTLLLVGIVLIAIVPNLGAVTSFLQGSASASSTFFSGFGGAVRGQSYVGGFAA